ncbi:apolipoprotein N-acyltransferase [Salinisphaera sp.]|uniref:apolipoprotein N-acyltransferase n=1 Tax=Salinisphaera sp. TaxID=1914330 RepID=UPI002D775FBF|nr:apolipoprotein N-acyltransferase [Salinisphaera sp.]HET7315239.1 apolipoprotein N-acyltransferase [Salinisphaera sp.]
MQGSSIRSRLRAAGWPALICAALAGGVSVLAFAPFGAFWVAPLAVAVLFRLVDHARARRAALVGLAFGIGQFAAGTYWILIALSGVGGAPLSLAVALLVALIVLLSAFIALTLGLAVRLAPGAGALRYLLWLPLCWTLVEWLRSWVFSGFPWLSLGYSQIDSPLVGLAPILGVFGVSWAVALTAGLLAWLSVRPRRAPWAIGAAVVLWGGAFGLGHIAWTQPSGEARTVTLVQGNVAQQAKWTPEWVNQAIYRYTGLTRGHWQSDLVIWPETAIPDYYRAVKPALDNLGAKLASHGTTLITGLLRVSDDGQRIYNSVVAVGAGQGLYSKRHLVPFGEYFPVPDIVRRWMAASGMPYSDITPGALDQAPIDAGGIALGISICYEDIFGALLARDVPPANVLINVSDDAWFGHSIGPDQHFEIARMRAVETGRYLLRADNSAVTGIVAPDGHVVDRAPDFESAVVTGRFRPYSGLTPFARWGNYGVVILALLVAGAGGLVRFARGRRGPPADHGL